MKKPPFIRSPYNYDLDQASNEAAYVETMPSLTIQSQSEDADLNVIMKRVGLGMPMPQNPRTPEYGDYTQVKDFRTALEAVRAAETEFMKYPANVRAAFQNDPQAFLEAFHTPGYEEQLRNLGLLKPKPIQANPDGPQKTDPSPTQQQPVEGK